MKELDIRCLISGEDTDGRVAVFEEVVQPGAGPPLHTHREQIEIFHIIEGQFRFQVDGKEMELAEGDSALVPMGAVHAFRNIGENPARIHFELLPALKSEESFRVICKEADLITDPAAFFDEHGMDLMGPPLEA